MPSKPSSVKRRSVPDNRSPDKFPKSAAPPTNSLPSQSDVSNWPNEPETSDRLRCSVRTVRRYVERGELERRLREVPGQRPESVFNPEDIERLMVEKPFFPGESLKLQSGSQQLQATSQTMPVPLHPALAQTILIFQKLAEPIFEQNQKTLASLTEGMELIRRSLPEAPETPPARFKMWMTISEASEYSSLTEGLLRRLARSGKLPSLRDGKGIKVRRSDLDMLAGELPARVDERKAMSVSVGDRSVTNGAVKGFERIEHEARATHR